MRLIVASSTNTSFLQHGGRLIGLGRCWRRTRPQVLSSRCDVWRHAYGDTVIRSAEQLPEGLEYQTMRNAAAQGRGENPTKRAAPDDSPPMRRRSSRLRNFKTPKVDMSLGGELNGDEAEKELKSEEQAQNGSQGEEMPPPSTPAKRRRRAPGKAAPPATPTPSAVGLIAEPSTRGPVTPKPKHKSVNRLAGSNATNAPLLSPETSRVVRPNEPEAVSTGELAGPSSAAESLLEKACQYLIEVDARMKPLIEKHPCKVFSPEGLAEKIDPFESLSSGIISQQVSGQAARSIKTKFIGLFPETPGHLRFPTPSQVAASSIPELRSAGLSQRKAEYIQGLAEKFTSGEITAQMLMDAPYEEVFKKLIAVRGLGAWSVEMFACFGLKRPDVFSIGDLGVQRGMAAFVGKNVSKMRNAGGKWKYMSEKDMLEVSSRFAPYRSLFMWYMWRVEETDVSTME